MARVSDKPALDTVDQLLGLSDGTVGPISNNNLSAQLVGSGPLAMEMDTIRSQVTSGLLAPASWAELQALNGAEDAAGAEVPLSDDGTHQEATATGYDGDVVANSGRFRWVAAWSRWLRIAEYGGAVSDVLLSVSGTGDALSTTADRAYSKAPMATKFVLEVMETNTGAVTVEIDAGPARPLISSTGGALEAGNLLPGQIIEFRWDGASYRLIPGTTLASSVQRAEDARDAALAAQDAAQTSASNAATAQASAANSAGIATAQATAAAADAETARIAALAASAAPVTALTDPVPANDTVELLQTTAGAQVWQVVGGAWNFEGWLFGPSIQSIEDLRLDASATLGSIGTIFVAGGYRFEVVGANPHLTTPGGVLLQARPVAGCVSLAQFTDDPSETADNAPAFKACAEFCAAHGYKMIVPQGTWRLASSQVAYLSGDLTIENYGVIWNDDVAEFGFNSGPVVSLTLASNVTRGDTTITVTDASGVAVGDLVDIYDTEDVVEADWGYYAAETHRAIAVDAGTGVITLDRPALWDYTAASGDLAVGHYPDCTLTLVGGAWRASRANGNFKFTGLRLHTSGLTMWTEDEETDNVWGFVCYACSNVRVRDTSMAGFSYGLLLNRCHDVLVDGLVGRNVRHEIDASTWTDGVTIRNVKSNGGQTTLASHPSFNITFENVVETNKTDSNKIRSAGITIKNCRTHTLASNPSYTARVIFSDMTIWDDYGTTIDGWTIDSPNANADGEALSIQYGAFVTAKNLSCREIFLGLTGTGLKKAQFTGGEVGRLRLASSVGDLTVRDMALNNALYYAQDTYLVYADTAGPERMKFEGCEFIAKTGAGTPTAVFYDAVDSSADGHDRVLLGCRFRDGVSNIVWGAGENNRWALIGCYSDGTLPSSRLSNSEFIGCSGFL